MSILSWMDNIKLGTTTFYPVMWYRIMPKELTLWYNAYATSNLHKTTRKYPTSILPPLNEENQIIRPLTTVSILTLLRFLQGIWQHKTGINNCFIYKTVTRKITMSLWKKCSPRLSCEYEYCNHFLRLKQTLKENEIWLLFVYDNNLQVELYLFYSFNICLNASFQR